MLAIDSKKKKTKQNKARDYKGGGSCLKEKDSRLTSFESSVKITGYYQGLCELYFKLGDIYDES